MLDELADPLRKTCNPTHTYTHTNTKGNLTVDNYCHLVFRVRGYAV